MNYARDLYEPSPFGSSRVHLSFMSGLLLATLESRGIPGMSPKECLPGDARCY